uniref:Uncharacterized protein n=1 Tax=Pristionchus pacificus TaxID=54126 RepID=A0A2A6C001_PRIPA|eukprot:PDM71426.1 hypothetical protein PRIPAC_37833 [Pristionchus pacificus]
MLSTKEGLGWTQEGPEGTEKRRRRGTDGIRRGRKAAEVDGMMGQSDICITWSDNEQPEKS